MKKKERLHQIEQLLNAENEVYFDMLSKKLRVSTMTIRRDLKHLEEENKVRFIVGGAKYIQPIHREEAYHLKYGYNDDIKRQIAKKAYHLIKEGEVIILDAGTTTYKMAEFLVERPLKDVTILSNDIHIIHFLLNHSSYRVIVLGGTIEPSSHSTIGNMTSEQVQGLSADKVFIGVSSMDEALNFYTPTEEKARLKNLMIKHSKKSILLCDKNKFDRKNLFFINNASICDYLITDFKWDREKEKKLEENKLIIIKV